MRILYARKHILSILCALCFTNLLVKLFLDWDFAALQCKSSSLDLERPTITFVTFQLKSWDEALIALSNDHFTTESCFSFSDPPLTDRLLNVQLLRTTIRSWWDDVDLGHLFYTWMFRRTSWKAFESLLFIPYGQLLNPCCLPPDCYALERRCCQAGLM